MSEELWKLSLYDLNVTKLYDESKELIKDGGFTQSNIIDVCLALMKLVEQYNLEGKQKKELVLAVLKKLCLEFGIPESTLDFISIMIDRFVSIDNREVRIAGKKICCF